METVIKRIGGINKVVVKHNHQAFILQCAEADVEYFKHCFDAMIDCFRKERKALLIDCVRNCLKDKDSITIEQQVDNYLLNKDD